MDTRKESRSCRICGSVVPPTHCVALFSTTSGLADRLSKVADVPVAPDDGLAKFICGICNRKFLLAESFYNNSHARLVMRRAMPHPLTLVVLWVHKLRSHEREPRIPVALRHLLTLASVDLWPRLFEAGHLVG